LRIVLYIGQMYYRLGNRDKAISAYENCVNLAQNDQDLKKIAYNGLSLARQLPIATVTPVPISVQVPLTDTNSVSLKPSQQGGYPPPRIKFPSDTAFIAGNPTRFEWEWEGKLAPDEYFDLKIRPIDDPKGKSVFVDWTKETSYSFNPMLDPKPPLEGGKRYLWSIQVLQGYYDNNGNKGQYKFLSPESMSNELEFFPELYLPETGGSFVRYLIIPSASIFLGVSLLSIRRVAK
jgi:hypothetical protein